MEAPAGSTAVARLSRQLLYPETLSRVKKNRERTREIRPEWKSVGKMNENSKSIEIVIFVFTVRILKSEMVRVQMSYLECERV